MRSATHVTAFARLGLLAAVATWMVVAVATADPPVQSVAGLDMQRYAGTWFEIARTPNRLQERCVGDATVTWSPVDAHAARLVRRCREAGDRWSQTVGDAIGEDDDRTGARFHVSYVPSWLRWWPQTRDRQWVVLLDEHYRYVRRSATRRANRCGSWRARRRWTAARMPASWTCCATASTRSGVSSRRRSAPSRRRLAGGRTAAANGVKGEPS
jgi:lipocalin